MLIRLVAETLEVRKHWVDMFQVLKGKKKKKSKPVKKKFYTPKKCLLKMKVFSDKHKAREFITIIPCSARNAREIPRLK